MFYFEPPFSRCAFMFTNNALISPSTETCTVPSLHFATSIPAAGSIVTNGSTVLVLCNIGYFFGKDTAFKESTCNSYTNTLPDCHREFDTYFFSHEFMLVTGKVDGNGRLYYKYKSRI